MAALCSTTLHLSSFHSPSCVTVTSKACSLRIRVSRRKGGTEFANPDTKCRAPGFLQATEATLQNSRRILVIALFVHKENLHSIIEWQISATILAIGPRALPVTPSGDEIHFREHLHLSATDQEIRQAEGHDEPTRCFMQTTSHNGAASRL